MAAQIVHEQQDICDSIATPDLETDCYFAFVSKYAAVLAFGVAGLLM